WFFETMKWRSLLNHFEDYPLEKTFRAVFAGITVSLFTPNRIGEYGGRVLFLPPHLRWKGTMSTLAGSLAQLIVLIGFGLLAIAVFSVEQLQLEGWAFMGAASLCSVGLLILILTYYNLEIAIRVADKLPRWSWLEKAKKPVRYLAEFDPKALTRALKFAGLRYGVYALQYYLVALFFGIQTGPMEAFMVIGSIYLLQTSIPLPPIWSLLVRGQVALYFWGFFCSNPILILSATFGVWVINLILPALLGMVFLMFLNIPKTLSYEAKKY
ncbi:MAG: hypothetical protein HKN16_13785, partial [Saprospiraceae bacterium]|nr:hypothetical protein [Saprospiraceae bacterium]